MGKIYSIVSGKGGVGKTTSAINLGAALNKMGENVLVVDVNLSTPNVGLHLGAPVVPITLNHVLSGRAEVLEAIYEHDSGLRIMPASLSITELKKINHEKLTELGEELRKISKHVIFDSSAGLGQETIASINAADEIILVTQAELPSVTDALKTIKLIEQLEKGIKGFIITRYRGKKSEMPLENIKDMLEVPLLGIIPEDKNMQKALSMKNPILDTHPKSKASKAYEKIAVSLLGSRYVIRQNFYEKLRDKLRS